MEKIITLLLFLGVITSFPYITYAQQYYYQITDLGTLGGVSSNADSINNNGLIVGDYVNSLGISRGFLYDNGTMIDIGSLGGDSTNANRINNNGQIAGSSQTSSGAMHPFLYDSGIWTQIDNLGGPNGGANSLNDNKQVVGTSDIGGSPNYNQAFSWINGKITRVVPFPHEYSSSRDVNNRGQVVGMFTDGTTHHAFLYNDGVFTDLGTPDGFAYSEAFGINEKSQIAAIGYNNSGGMHGFLYDGGVWTDIGTLGGQETWVKAINESSQIVGYESDYGITRAFVWDDGQLTELPSLGGNYTIASGINDYGQIVGSSETSTGETHAVLWTVVPEPISSILFVTGGALLAGRYYLKRKKKA